MDARDSQETISEVAGRGGRYVALLISILAAMLALVEVSGGDAEQDATTNNIAAANLWSFYQAKTIRRSNLEQLAELVELELPDLAPERASGRASASRPGERRPRATTRSRPPTRAARSSPPVPRRPRRCATGLSRPTTCSTTARPCCSSGSLSLRPRSWLRSRGSPGSAAVSAFSPWASPCSAGSRRP